MPRFRLLEREDAPVDARPFYDADIERYGTVLNNTKLYSYNVGVLKAVKLFAGVFAETKAIAADQKSLIRVRVASLNGCPF